MDSKSTFSTVGIQGLDGVSVIYLKDITEAYPLSYHGILVYLSSASGNRAGGI